jgi:hypothetical protein
VNATQFKARMRALLGQLHDHPEALDELTEEFSATTSPGKLFPTPSDGTGEFTMARAIYGSDHPALIEDTGAAETGFQIMDAYLSTTREANAAEREGLFALTALVALEG